MKTFLPSSTNFSGLLTLHTFIIVDSNTSLLMLLSIQTFPIRLHSPLYRIASVAVSSISMDSPSSSVSQGLSHFSSVSFISFTKLSTFFFAFLLHYPQKTFLVAVLPTESSSSMSPLYSSTTLLRSHLNFVRIFCGHHNSTSTSHYKGREKTKIVCIYIPSVKTCGREIVLFPLISIGLAIPLGKFCLISHFLSFINHSQNLISRWIIRPNSI